MIPFGAIRRGSVTALNWASVLGEHWRTTAHVAHCNRNCNQPGHSVASHPPLRLAHLRSFTPHSGPGSADASVHTEPGAFHEGLRAPGSWSAVTVLRGATGAIRVGSTTNRLIRLEARAERTAD